MLVQGPLEGAARLRAVTNTVANRTEDSLFSALGPYIKQSQRAELL